MSRVSAPRTSPTMIRSGRMRRELRTSSRMRISPSPSMFGGRDSSVITWSCWSWSSAASSIVTMRSSFGTKAEREFSVVVLPVPAPPEMRTWSFPRTHAERNCAASGEIEPKLTRSSIVYGSRELPDRQRRPAQRERRGGVVDTATVRQAGIHHGGGLVHSAADLRDDLVDDAQQVRAVDEGRVGELDLAVPLDVDTVVVVDHHLGHGVVAQQRLERPVAEDVVGDLARGLRPLLTGEGRPVGRGLL